MPHLEGFSNSPYPEPNNQVFRIVTYCFNFHSNIDLPSTLKFFLKCLFSAGLPVKNLKALLPPSILATYPAHLNLLYLITLAT